MENIKKHPLYGRHDLDSAMSSLWQFYKTRFLTLFFISFLMSIVSQYATQLINFRELQNLTEPYEMLTFLKSKIVPIISLMVLSLLFSTMLHYFVLVRPLNESSFILTPFWKSLRYFIPYLIIIIIFSFAGSFLLVIGLLMLIVGVFFAALYLGMISFFILPVMMVEGDNIGRVIIRTLKLSHKNFWPNIGWSAVFFILYLVVSMVLSGLVMLPFTGTFLKALSNPQEASSLMDIAVNPAMLLASSVASAVMMPLFPIFGFILYFNGRAREEVDEQANPKDNAGSVRVEDLYAPPRRGEE